MTASWAGGSRARQIPVIALERKSRPIAQGL
jgi:hypothetical protein